MVGRYELLRELGRGGTATVYLARQTELNRLVALKELSALPVSDPATARRFVRESRLVGSLNHPNIVTVHDFFEDHATPYIAMEYIERGSLRPLMQRLSFAQVAGVLEGVLAGLGHAQEHAIVHRDLKPENLMVTADGRVKIADFGIAKVTDAAQAGTVLTVKGTTIGTPTYMAPEQALAENIGPWTDLYAVGIIAFELLSGRPPFDTSGTPMAMLLRHVNDEPAELSTVMPTIDPRLSDWISHLLEKEPRERPQSAGPAWMSLEEIVLDKLGPRWRHSSALLEEFTPPTLPMARRERTAAAGVGGAAAAAGAAPDQSFVPTEPPSYVPTQRRERGAGAGAAAALGAGAAARIGPASLSAATAARRYMTPILLMLALVLAAVAFAVSNGNRGGSPASGPGGRPQQQQQQPQQPAPAGPAGQSAPSQSQPDRSGVGDSQSDDPSDDEPDRGEP